MEFLIFVIETQQQQQLAAVMKVQRTSRAESSLLGAI